MKKILTFFAIVALVVSTGIVGCGGAADNTTKKTDTAGKKAPKMEKDETQGEEQGKKKTTAAGGEAKTATAPE
jgi:hypothetical protein